MKKIIPKNEISFQASLASGPGGQHVQKTKSRVTLRFDVNASKTLTEDEKVKVLKKLSHRINKDGELIIHVETHRSQLRNKETAYEYFHKLINGALKKSKIHKKTKPPKRAIERRLKEKKITSKKKKSRKKLED